MIHINTLTNNRFLKSNADNIYLIATTTKGVSVEEWKYIVAYYENQKISDVFFDGFMLVPELSYVFCFDEDNRGYKKLNKSDWLYYIHNIMLKDGCNLDALELAVDEMKAELKDKYPEIVDYKVEIYFPILRLFKRDEPWGEVDGKEIDCNKNEDRVTAFKWLINESIRAINAKQYKNIKIGAAYYSSESLSNDLDDALVMKQVTDYIRSLGLTTLWVPYYLANGWNSGREYGFDKIVLQANFFPGGKLPNAGGIERLEDTAKKAIDNGYLMEMEFCGTEVSQIEAIKEYFKIAIKYGFIEKFHAWWVGAKLKMLSEATDPYIHSVYVEMKKYIDRTLTAEEILS